MATSIQVKAAPRDAVGGRRPHRLRKQGLVPAVLYSKRTQATSLQIVTKDLTRAVNKVSGENVLVDLEVEGFGKKLALLQDIQHDPLNGNIMHVDLHELAQDEKLHTHIPVEPVGLSVGVKTYGGIFERVLRELHVACLPKDLPDRIEVDVTNLNVGEAIHVGDVKLPEGVEVLNQKDLTLFIVAAPKEEVALPAGAVAAQPEVLKEKKAEAGAAGAKAAPAAKAPAKK